MHELGPVLALFAASFLLALSGALAPGPLLTVTISEALKKGARAGPLIVLGHGIIELALVSAVAAGLGRFLKLGAVTGTIGLVGGLVLLWMGAGMARTAAPVAEKAVSALAAGHSGPHSDGSNASHSRSVLLGIVVSLTNPYWTIWWVTAGLSLLTKALKIGVLAVGAFYVGHILADLVWYWAVAIGVSKGIRWLNVKVYRAVLLGCAVLLLGMGIYFGSSGIISLTAH